MKRFLLPLLGTASLILAAGAQARTVTTASSESFRNSIGVNTHIVYFDTPYSDWSRIVSELQSLGVTHLRDGVYANPAPSWHDWNQRYYDDVEYAAAHGLKFDFGMGEPGFRAGTLDQLAKVVSGPLRNAVEGLEAPNEFDHFGAVRNWSQALATYDRALYEAVKHNASLRSLPVIGPSLMGAKSPAELGNQAKWLDLGNIHPYTGGQAPTATHTESELARAARVAPGKRVWATEAGFNNALRAPVTAADQPPVSEHAGAIYTLQTVLDNYKSGIARTYLYELIDESADPGNAAPEEHYGLLRSNFTPKPAFTALKNLLELVGSGAPSGAAKPPTVRLTGSSDVNELELEHSDGTVSLVLWRSDSVWSTTRRRSLNVRPVGVRVALPAHSRVRRADPIASASSSAVRLLRGGAVIHVGADPIVLQITRGG